MISNAMVSLIMTISVIIAIILTILIVTTITGPLPTVYKWCQQTISGLPVFTPLHFSANKTQIQIQMTVFTPLLQHYIQIQLY